MIRGTSMARCSGKTRVSTKGSGLKGPSTDMERCTSQMATRKKVYMRMASSFRLVLKTKLQHYSGYELKNKVGDIIYTVSDIMI
jgi:hypothetical protein